MFYILDIIIILDLDKQEAGNDRIPPDSFFLFRIMQR